MSGPASEPAFLDDAGSVIFKDTEHFQTEVEGNVRSGRLLLRCRQAPPINASLKVRITAPEGAGELTVTTRVVFVQGDLVGLQLTDLDDDRRRRLDELVRYAKDPSSRPPEPPAPEPPAPAPPTVHVPGPTGSGDVESSPAPSADSSAPPASGAPAPAPAAAVDPRWPTLERDGRVRLSDEAVTLGLYLLALRGGQLLLRIDGDPPPPARALFEMGERSATVDIVPIQLGDGFGLFDVPDPIGLADLVEGSGAAVAPLLGGVGLCATGDLETSSRDLDAPSTADVPGPPSPRTPRPARLDGQVVLFEEAEDLIHELNTNVKNGGLFVESPPLPLRQRLDLRFRVGNRMLSPTLAADVVFADGGRVGFSLGDASRARAELETALRSPSSQPMSSETPAPVGGTTTLDLRLKTDDVSPSFSGRIAPPLQVSWLIDLQRHRVQDASGLGRATVLQVFEFLVRHKWNGVLQLRSTDGGERDVHFYRGDVAFVSARPFEEHTSLGRILIGQRKINETQLREALDRGRGSPRLLGRMLVLLGSLRRKDLTAALREQTRAKMDSAFRWSGGEYSWGPWTEPPGEADLVVTKGLSVIERHLRSELETLTHVELEELLEPSMTRVVTPTNMDTIASSLRLSQKELRFLELQLDGTRNVHDATTGSPLGRLGSLRLVAAGIALGMLELHDGDDGPQSSSTAATKSPGPKRSSTSELRLRLERRLGSLKSESHFDVLGVHWSSHHRGYERAWRAARAEFDVKSPPLDEAPEGTRKLAREIVRRIDEAYETLSRKEKRIAYRRELFDNTERAYSADMLLKQAEVALMRSDRTAALEALETAAELNPTSKILDLLRNARER
jgi:hypothetical protein